MNDALLAAQDARAEPLHEVSLLDGHRPDVRHGRTLLRLLVACLVLLAIPAAAILLRAGRATDADVVERAQLSSGVDATGPATASDFIAPFTIELSGSWSVLSASRLEVLLGDPTSPGPTVRRLTVRHLGPVGEAAASIDIDALPDGVDVADATFERPDSALQLRLTVAEDAPCVNPGVSPCREIAEAGWAVPLRLDRGRTYEVSLVERSDRVVMIVAVSATGDSAWFGRAKESTESIDFVS